MFLSEFNQKVNQAKPLDFGVIFSQAIELFKKVWVQGLITVLISIVGILPLYGIIYIPLLMVGVDPELMASNDELNVPFLILGALFFIAFIILASAFSIALMAAFYRICKQRDLEESVKDDYFYYFKKAYFMKLIKLSVVGIAISLLASILFLLPLFYVMVPMSFLTVIFAFNPEARVTDIVKASFKLGHKKWLITFGLMLICGILAEMVGLILCFVGLFATVSFAYLPLYIIYKEVIGFENSEDETVSIERH
ncbi:conserved hypothetical membrane protein (DUF4013) [Formosa agariphila KMM 3901]|uniref:Conserved hypothetical membrane protein (DUF4013) n=1 Tax=Formosa agariphila (strain DSM 15362 / KCTC 12365 / LMG 23005 / KMM 3901 / M-2Alg 35-1) TaxID=1347342 RepID=T2KJH7_FORAG|nr:hypothetical protein [Formosa agariphila]CDF78144.1 conserved hypothetical membrane protein (DUF4013) [Formosa agariphila KMM 3901]